MADPDDELADAVRELTRTIDDLRHELESGQRSRPRRRPSFPRPPTPQEFLRFADSVAIPATIAVLETSVRALKGFQRALELARTEREVRNRTTDAASGASERASELRRTTLSRLDTVLAELQRASSDGRLPADEGARDLLSEARALRDDVDSRLRDAAADLEARETEASAETDSIRIDIEDGTLGESSADVEADEPDTGVDVDAELETLKDQYGADEDDEDDEDDAGDANDADGSDSSAAADGDERDGSSEKSDADEVDGDAGSDSGGDDDPSDADSGDPDPDS